MFRAGPLVVYIAGYYDNRQMRPAAPRGGGDLDAILAWQADIGDERIEGHPGLDPAECLRPRAGGGDEVTRFPQDLGQDVAYFRLILHQKDGAAFLLERSSPGRWQGSWRARRRELICTAGRFGSLLLMDHARDAAA